MRCRECSWQPKTEPKVFCPMCGAMWKKTAESKSPAKSKLGDATKKKAVTKKAPAKKKAASKKGK